jgi:hypothetical protein
MKISELYEDAKKQSLINKSKSSSIPYRFLKRVYDKGMGAWNSGHRPGIGQDQWAMARVNSFVSGKGGARKADQEIWDEYKKQK